MASSSCDRMLCPSGAASLPSALTCRPWSLKNSPAFSMTCSSVSCPKGWDLQSISTSHRVTPKAHTSLAVVNFPWHAKRKKSREKSQARVDVRFTHPHPGCPLPLPNPLLSEPLFLPPAAPCSGPFLFSLLLLLLFLLRRLLSSRGY